MENTHKVFKQILVISSIKYFFNVKITYTCHIYTIVSLVFEIIIGAVGAEEAILFFVFLDFPKSFFFSFLY